MNTKTESFPGWTPVQIARFYGFPMDASGKGQTIAIIDLGQTVNLVELAKDFSFLRIAMPQIEIIEVGNTPTSTGDSTETHLDIEVIASICPAASIKVYRCALTIEAMAQAIKAAVADNVDVISISWGGSEKVFHQDVEDALIAASKANISVCVATGDYGSSQYRNQANHPTPAPDGLAHCGYPASSPWVLACGGTQLLIDENHNKSEVVWNNTPAEGRSISGGATGGGVSTLFERPDWQRKANIQIENANNQLNLAHKGDASSSQATESTENKRSTKVQEGRVIPDVSGLAAAGDWQIGLNATTDLIGGTSAVAPMWASLIALINEKRAALQPAKPRLGFINEALYQIEDKSSYFNDITQGSNRISNDYPGYDASQGFDACGGWGTPKASAISEYLVQQKP